MKISVTQEHISAGKKEDCQKCPIALAIIEVLPDTHVSVFADLKSVCNAPAQFRDAYVRINGEARYLPREASDFIDSFDCGRPVVPFEFDLEYSL